jgi:hypothetical protein
VSAAGRSELEPLSNPWDPFRAFRCFVVCTQAATIWITWPLWQVRLSPPLLPATNVPQIDFGYLLLGSLLLALIHGKIGILAHTVLLGAAMLSDQMRLQPEFISQAILLWGTLPWRGARMACRAHLVALWFFAGFNKLLSPLYLSGDARWLVVSFYPQAPEAVSTGVGVVIALTEIGLAVCAAVPRSRHIAVGLAGAIHVGIVVTLAFGLHWDPAVWPWNLALAVAGYVIIGSWKEGMPEEWRQLTLAARGITAVILLLPVGYYVGLVDTYLCHILYSNHAPLAWIRTPDGRRFQVDTRPQLRVPVPQIERLYTAYFAATGKPGEELEIADPRLWYRWRRADRRVLPYEKLRDCRCRQAAGTVSASWKNPVSGG